MEVKGVFVCFLMDRKGRIPTVSFLGHIQLHAGKVWRGRSLLTIKLFDGVREAFTGTLSFSYIGAPNG